MANRTNLPPLWRFDYGDYAALCSVFQKFLSNLNLFTLAVYNLLNGGIGFANMQRAVYSATVTANTITSLSFVNPLPVPPSGLVLIQVLQHGTTNTAIANPVSVANWFYDGKYINILNIAGLTAGVTYEISMEVC